MTIFSLSFREPEAWSAAVKKKRSVLVGAGSTTGAASDDFSGAVGGEFSVLFAGWGEEGGSKEEGPVGSSGRFGVGSGGWTVLNCGADIMEGATADASVPHIELSSSELRKSLCAKTMHGLPRVHFLWDG